jgi:hypothetical protein
MCLLLKELLAGQYVRRHFCQAGIDLWGRDPDRTLGWNPFPLCSCHRTSGPDGEGYADSINSPWPDGQAGCAAMFRLGLEGCVLNLACLLFSSIMRHIPHSVQEVSSIS